MDARNDDPLWRSAARVADCLSECGYAFLEDDELADLVDVLRDFLQARGLPNGEASGGDSSARPR
jgi:hypothetical protein